MTTNDTLCIRCHQPAYNNCYSDAGRREVAISGLCEKCFDEITDIDDKDQYEEEESK